MSRNQPVLYRGCAVGYDRAEESVWRRWPLHMAFGRISFRILLAYHLLLCAKAFPEAKVAEEIASSRHVLWRTVLGSGEYLIKAF